MNQPEMFPARHTDPATSHLAAAALTYSLDERHARVLSWLAAYGPATDDTIAGAMVAAGLWSRHEQARRAIRTLRENHLLIRPVIDDDGLLVLGRNESGRAAIMYEVAL